MYDGCSKTCAANRIAMTSASPYPVYPFPTALFWRLAAAALLGRTRSFRQDAQETVRSAGIPLQVAGREHIPASGPFLLVCNHYWRPGFHAWWFVLALSSVIPVEMRWLVTEAWTFCEQPALRFLTPLTRWAFRRAARVYGFSALPAMPPDPAEVEQRAAAVRAVLRCARQAPEPAVALAPEGMDMPGGLPGAPPPGVGRFVRQLARYCGEIVPVGVYEERQNLCLNFGAGIQLSSRGDANPEETDRQTSAQVMKAIASLLPEDLRGAYR